MTKRYETRQTKGKVRINIDMNVSVRKTHVTMNQHTIIDNEAGTFDIVTFQCPNNNETQSFLNSVAQKLSVCPICSERIKPVGN
jgi:hypothetical protein